MGKFTDKVVFITGSSKGIGKTIAAELVRRGAIVVLNGRNVDVLQRAAEELSHIAARLASTTGKKSRSAKDYNGTGKGAGRSVKGLSEPARTLDAGREKIMQIAADVSDTKAFDRALKDIINRFGKLDVLILNAGVSSYGAVEKTSDNTLQRVMQTNTFGPFIGARSALPFIRESKGSIVFISSLAGLHGLPHSSVYCMSKMAITALAQSLKTELTGQGIHIGIVYVGFTQNDPEKTTIGPDGKDRPIQSRPGWIQQSPDRVALLILRNISRRRFRSTLSSMGKSMAFLSRHFPRLFQFAMRSILRQAKKLTAD